MSENKLKEHYYEKGIITALWETGGELVPYPATEANKNKKGPQED